jgi:hypothetical protein
LDCAGRDIQPALRRFETDRPYIGGKEKVNLFSDPLAMQIYTPHPLGCANMPGSVALLG